jgi:Domain of unknown function (DUF4157)
VKQGVQLVLERVQRHRAFPRLAAANGQNLATTLSPVNAAVVSRLERPRFVPVLAEAKPGIPVLAESGIPVLAESGIPVLAESADLGVQDQPDSPPNVETRDESNALTEQMAFEPETELLAQEFQNTSQASEPTLALEPAQLTEGIRVVEHDTQNSSNDPTPEISASDLPVKGSTPTTPKAPATRTASGQAQAVNPQQISQQVSGIQARESQTKPSTAGQFANSDATQPQTRETLAAKQNNSSVEASQTPEFGISQTPRFEANSEQDISLKFETNQIENTRLISDQALILNTDTLLENQNPVREDVKQITDTFVETQAKPSTQIEHSAQPIRSPSRLESTLEALRQFHPKHSESAIQADSGLLQSIKPDTRALKAAGVQQTTRPETTASTSRPPVIPEKSPVLKVEKSIEARAASTVETLNQGLNTIQTSKAALEPQAVTRANPVQAQAVRTQSAELKAASELNQAEPSALKSTPIETIQPDLATIESQPFEHPRESLQAEASRIEAVRADQPDVQPDFKPEPARLESNNQRPATQNPRDGTEPSSDTRPSVPAATPTQPPSEEAREREAYQRSVMLRAERAKRVLAAKEELERDPTDEPQTSQTPAAPSGEAQQNAVPARQSALEPEPETKRTPSLESALEPRADTVMAEAGSTDAFTQNTLVIDSNIALESNQQLAEDNSRDQFASDPENLSQATTLPVNESPIAISSETQPPNSGEPQTVNPSEIQVSDSSQTPRSNSSQSATANQDLPASFLKMEGVSVYNPQRRIQRTIPAPPAKPKPEPNAAEKLFAEMPEISEQEILQMIRKAQGQSTPTKNQTPAIRPENPQVNNARATNNLSETLEQANSSLTELMLAAQASQNARVEQVTQDARVEQANNQSRGVSPETTTQALDVSDSSNASDSGLMGSQTSNTVQANARTSQTNTEAVKQEPVRHNATDAQGNKIHVFNPPNRRVVLPKPKIEQPKTEAEKLFDAIEVTETADELFQRVVKNRLKPNVNLEPLQSDISLNLNSETPDSSIDTPNANQALKPNLPNLSSQNSSNQAANASVTGNPSVQLSQNARRFLKPIVGIDPNDVKIYRDPQTERITKAARADALTVDETILLSSEQALESPETLGLIAHELTHVARNRQARFVPPVAYSNANLAASAQAGNEEGLALGVEAIARQGWTNLNQNTNQNTPNQNFSSQTPPHTATESTDRSRYGGLPAPADLPQWFIEDRTPPQTSRPSAPRAKVASMPVENSFVPKATTNTLAASIGAQAASQGRDVPSPPPAAGPLPASSTPKPEPNSTRAAPDLDAMARQVYTILKRRLANERYRM